MSRKLKIQWAVWVLMATVVAIGTWAFEVSSTSVTVPLSLTKNAGVGLSVFRLFPANVTFSIDFKRKGGDRRLELGDSTRSGNPWVTGVLHFPTPGEPVKLRLVYREEVVVFEALPAGSFGVNGIGRDLVPYHHDSDPQSFPWPPRLIGLTAGTSHLQIVVDEVGSLISGEPVSLIVHPPLTFKTAMPGYGFLWWFFFWPVYAGALAVYASVLIWWGRKNQ